MTTTKLQCDGEEIAVRQFTNGRPVRGSVLMMHGAGLANMERTLLLAQDLADAGFGVTAFDFSGHGASSGALCELSLERRFTQACQVIDRLIGRDQSLTLIGFSMSGQTIGDLLAEYGERVIAIGLCSPAVYSQAAWPLLFDDEFTRSIRTEGAWRDSSALNEFAKFSGRAVLATPEDDSVIPSDVTAAIERSLKLTSDFKRLVFHEAEHRLGVHFAKNLKSRATIIAALTR